MKVLGLRSALLSSVLFPLLAVRKTSWGVSPDLPPPVQVQPYSSMTVVIAPQAVRPYVGKGLYSPPQPLERGVEAYFSSIQKDLEDSMRQDLDQLRDLRDLQKALGLDAEAMLGGTADSDSSILPSLPDLVKEPSPAFLHDLDDLMTLPPVPDAHSDTKRDSITRRLQITEENGQRVEREEVTRCHDGKCSTEVVRGDDAKAPDKEAGELRADDDGRGDKARSPQDRRGNVEAPSQRRMSFESVARTVLGDRDQEAAKEAPPEAKDAPRRGWGLPGFGKKMQATDEAPPGPRVSVESVTRKIVSREVDGQYEAVETFERCQDGKCTREESRTGGAADGEKRADPRAKVRSGAGEPVVSGSVV